MRNDHNTEIPSSFLLEFRDLLDGLTYMHSEKRIGQFHKKKICHGDLKGVSQVFCHVEGGVGLIGRMLQSNYLVQLEPASPSLPDAQSIRGKITDFGLSYILDSELKSSISRVSEALKWRAPEMAAFEEDIAGREGYLEKADVWSFALTSLEVRLIKVSRQQWLINRFRWFEMKIHFQHTQVSLNSTKLGKLAPLPSLLYSLKSTTPIRNFQMLRSR